MLSANGRARTAGLTSGQLALIIVGVLFWVLAMVGLVAGVFLLPALARAREEARRIRCRNNLNQIAKGMAIYLHEEGDRRFYPCPLGRGRSPKDYNGAEWLASLYWTGTMPDPGVFICPSSPDSNDDGRHLGTSRASRRFGSQTVSYAGMHYFSLTDHGGEPFGSAIRDDFPPNEPMASDDTQGTINHGERNNGGMAVLFFDSRVVFKTNTEIDLETSVGDTTDVLEGPGRSRGGWGSAWRPAPLLRRLRN